MKAFINENAVLIGLAIAALIALLGILYFSNTEVCWNLASFRCKDARVQECVHSERYTLDQCVILIGGGK